MIGQEKILNYIDNSNIDTFPRTLMLVGDVGSGKHTIVNYASKHLCLDVVDVTETICYELIEEIQGKPQPYMYLIDGNAITQKTENAILKFLEEPLLNSFVILITTSKSMLLDTVINRCTVWELQQYTNEQLRYFTDDEQILGLCSTPGQIEKMKSQPIQEMQKLANTIVHKMGVANFANALTISNNIAYKDEKDKFNLFTFIKILLKEYHTEMMLNPSSKIANCYACVNNMYSTLMRMSSYDTKMLFEHCITNLWEISRDNTTVKISN